ncbi:ArsR family transcriptional regulator [Streptomyces sp. CB03234]|uniref:ArsR/SmtB family transcription factor n=1 Tax=Streptomyces sp. (strain CB03234) TaxID=1703937 RepID=UPI00093969D3|nr:winged helix-turn-helix domain-containing protein [Streptomyces sp. CB03234]OKK07607.1 ArsR family transcriptional regulator [Streptomyces sp. CB03234]
MPEPEKKSVRQLDPRSLRGLAHPLRIRLLAALRHHGPATASQLAERLGESSGATSYHLRQLATYGFVEDDPERGKGRERWWKAAQRGTAVDASLYDDESPETRGALNVFLHEIATIHNQELSTWVGTMRDWPTEWVKNSDLSDFSLRLNPEQVHELDEKLHALINSYADVEPGEGAARVRVHLHAFPQKND